jgi:hypothetical protein
MMKRRIYLSTTAILLLVYCGAQSAFASEVDINRSGGDDDFFDVLDDLNDGNGYVVAADDDFGHDAAEDVGHDVTTDDDVGHVVASDEDVGLVVAVAVEEEEDLGHDVAVDENIWQTLYVLTTAFSRVLFWLVLQPLKIFTAIVRHCAGIINDLMNFYFWVLSMPIRFITSGAGGAIRLSMKLSIFTLLTSPLMYAELFLEPKYTDRSWLEAENRIINLLQEYADLRVYALMGVHILKDIDKGTAFSNSLKEPYKTWALHVRDYGLDGMIKGSDKLDEMTKLLLSIENKEEGELRLRYYVETSLKKLRGVMASCRPLILRAVEQSFFVDELDASPPSSLMPENFKVAFSTLSVLSALVGFRLRHL